MKRLQYKDLSGLIEFLSRDDIFWTAKDDGVTKESLKTYLTGLLLNQDVYILSPSEGVIFFFWKTNSITFEMHVAIALEDRKKGFKGAELVGRWMFENTGCEKLMTYIPSHHKPAIMFASMCGMRREGVLTKAFKYDGENLDLIMMGATKDECYEIYKEV